MGLVSKPKPGDWESYNKAIMQLSRKLDGNADVTHKSLSLSGLTADCVCYADSSNEIATDTNLAWDSANKILDISGKVAVGSFSSPIDVTATREYGFEIHYSGNDYNATAIRARASAVTTDTSAQIQGGLFQAANNDNIDVGGLNGLLAEAIGKSDTTAATISMMRAGLFNAEWNAKDTITDLRTLHVRTHTRNNATEGYISNSGYGIYIENEAVGGNGQALDAGIYLKATNISGGSCAYDYGLDFSGVNNDEYSYAQIRLSNEPLATLSYNNLLLSRVEDIAAGPKFVGRKSKGTYSSPTAVTNNCEVFSLEGYGYDGGDFRRCAGIYGLVDGSVSDDDVPAGLGFYIRTAGDSDISKCLEIDSNGDFNFQAGNLTTAGIITAGGGSASAPAYTCSDADTGMWQSAANTLKFSLGGIGDALTLSALAFDYKVYNNVIALGPVFNFSKFKGTYASPSAVTSGCVLLKIVAKGGDDSSPSIGRISSFIQAIADGAFTSTSAPGRMEFYTTPSGSITAAKRIKIDNAGTTYIGDGGTTNYLSINSTGDLNFAGSAGIGAFTLKGKLTAGSNEIEGSDFDINGGDISACAISGGLTWSAAQDLNSQALTNVNIDSGTIDGTTITSPVINTGVSGTAIIDDDLMELISDTTLCTGESIKAYVDNGAHHASDGTIRTGYRYCNVQGSLTQVFTKYLTGTLDNDAKTTIAHGLTAANILSVTAITYNDNTSVYRVAEHYRPDNTNVELNVTYDANNIILNQVGAYLQGNAYRIKIEYTI